MTTSGDREARGRPIRRDLNDVVVEPRTMQSLIPRGNSSPIVICASRRDVVVPSCNMQSIR